MCFAKMTMLKSLATVLAGLLLSIDVVVAAQNLSTKQELAAIQQAEMANRTRLSHYTWQEVQFISVNGKAVDYRLYSVRSGAHGGKRNLVTEHTGQEATFEPNTKEQLSQYGPYVQRLYELTNQYMSVNGEQLTRADSRGELVLQREDGLIRLAIKNYTKPGDSLAMTIHQGTHRLISVRAKSYLSNPKDTVTIQAEFAELPDGTSHIDTAEIDSISKHLLVKLTNWSYQ
jgi:hypothetical protein